jgi:hypothetical protein
MLQDIDTNFIIPIILIDDDDDSSVVDSVAAKFEFEVVSFTTSVISSNEYPVLIDGSAIN